MTNIPMNREQLAKIFKSGLNESDEIIDVNQYQKASSARIQQAEKLAESNIQSGAQKIMLNLTEWTQSISNDIPQNTNRKSIFEKLFSDLLKPALASAFALGFVVVLNSDLNSSSSVIGQNQDGAMFTSSFDDAKTQSDVIKSIPFESNKNQDVIHSTNFG